MHPALHDLDVLLLDLNGTFMFGQDRFGPDQDYNATYQGITGRPFSGSLHDLMATLLDDFLRDYQEPACFDRFPTLLAFLRRHPATADLSDSEREAIAGVVAAHELGSISDDFAHAISRLAETHTLALVSNVWSASGPWRDELNRAGVLECFDVVVFSSDGASVKPSRRIFDDVLEQLGNPPCSRVAVVGDSLRCDIGGAEAAGLKSIWIDGSGEGHPGSGPIPEWIIHDLRELVAP